MLETLVLAVPVMTPEQRAMEALVRKAIFVLVGGLTTWRAQGWWLAPGTGPCVEEVAMILVSGVHFENVDKIILEVRKQARLAGERAIWYERRPDYTKIEMLAEVSDAAV